MDFVRWSFRFQNTRFQKGDCLLKQRLTRSLKIVFIDYGLLEKVKSVAWNGVIKGEVYDTCSGMGSVSAANWPPK
jgi:hypothetical protein